MWENRMPMTRKTKDFHLYGGRGKLKKNFQRGGSHDTYDRRSRIWRVITVMDQFTYSGTRNRASTLQLKAQSTSQVDSIAKAVKDLGFSAVTPAQILAQINSTFRVIQIVLAAFGVIGVDRGGDRYY